MAKVKKKKAKKPVKDLVVKLPKDMDFDEVMTRIVRVKPPKKDITD